MGRLSGKVALISGGSRGQGEAEAKLFSSEGAKVVLGDILDSEGLAVASEINESGGVALYVHLDVTSKDDWDSAVKQTLENFEGLDILVNNAGISQRKLVHETTVDEWDKVQDINSKGVFLGTKAVIPAMRAAGGGSIVNISSIAGIVGLTSSASYSAGKGAVRVLTKSTAVQYGPERIRCNSVHPGFIDTEMNRAWLEDEEIRAERLKMTPLNMFANSHDVALAVLYLSSDESRYVTGAELVIDGGIIAK